MSRSGRSSASRNYFRRCSKCEGGGFLSLAPRVVFWLKQIKQITHSESANALQLHPVCNGAAASVTA
jgi:hypothetical protein